MHSALCIRPKTKTKKVSSITSGPWLDLRRRVSSIALPLFQSTYANFLNQDSRKAANLRHQINPDNRNPSNLRHQINLDNLHRT